MFINSVEIEDTFAEAFPMWASRLTITAVNAEWALHAAQAAAGFATSVIGCGIEAAIEGATEETPDGRPGLDCLFFGMSADALEKQLVKRVGQAVMTAPTTACFNAGLPEYAGQEMKKIPVGGKIRYFGDGFQASKVIDGRRFWRIPVMEDEFLLDESFDAAPAVGGGNFLILGESANAVLAAAEAAVRAIRTLRGVIMPFPGGIVRSGSQVGSRYSFLPASTNIRYCPTITGRVENTALPREVNSVLEVVIDGLTPELVAKATREGILAACLPGVTRISAGNYGGKLGKHHFHLREILG